MAQAISLLVIGGSDAGVALMRACLSALPGDAYALAVEPDAANTTDQVKQLMPTVVFLGCGLDPARRVALIGEMRRQGLLHPVVVLSDQDDGYAAAEATRAGAAGYLSQQDLSTPRLPETIERVLAEAMADAPKRAERSETLTRINNLTPRETEVLDEIVNGLTNKQIAAKMHRSIETIKVHRAHIMSKLMADSTADLVRRVTHARVCA